MISDCGQEAWCVNCGHKQKVDHLGSQDCIKCNKHDWIDITSFERCNQAWQKQREEIGLV